MDEETSHPMYRKCTECGAERIMVAELVSWEDDDGERVRLCHACVREFYEAFLRLKAILIEKRLK